MLKAEMEKQLKKLHADCGKMIKGFRVDGICVQCLAEIGQQHKTHCPAWHLIHWRQKNHQQGLFGAERINLETPDGLI